MTSAKQFLDAIRIRSDNNTVGVISVAALVVLFAVLNRVMVYATRLPSSSYEEPIVFVALLQNVPRLSWKLLLTAVPLLVFAPLTGRLLKCRWKDLQLATPIRIIVVFAAFTTAWSFSTYRFNYAFGQSHAIDRVMIGAFFFATVWRPAFVLPFLAVVLPVAWQFNEPIGSTYMTVPLLSIRILILFLATLLLRSLTQSGRTGHFVFVLLCLWAGHYWPSGFGKLQLNWFQHNHVECLLPTTYANGWLGFLDAGTINDLTAGIGRFNLPIKVFTVMVEVGCLLFVVRRSAVVFFLAGAIALHIGILAISGIFFWPWIVLNTALLVVIRKYPAFYDHAVEGRWRAWMSIPLIAMSPVWIGAASLSWLEASATYTYRFEAVGQSGARYSIAPQDFAPYETQFATSAIHEISSDRILPISWGATRDLETTQLLRAAQSRDEVLEIEERLGQSFHNAGTAQDLRQLLERFAEFRSYPQTNGEAIAQVLRAPPYVCTFRRDDVWKGQEDIERIVVKRVFSCYCDGRYQEIREVQVLEAVVSIAASSRRQ